MNAELKDKWLAALRSGEYQQTRSALKNEDGYCCLGVLAHVYSGDWGRDNKKGYEKVREVLADKYTLDSLMCLNDTEDLSFPAIADWIETNIPSEP